MGQRLHISIRYTYAVRIGESRKGTQGRLLLLRAHELSSCMCAEKPSVLKFLVAYGPVAQNREYFRIHVTYRSDTT
jgi:hypothetical protein